MKLRKSFFMGMSLMALSIMLSSGKPVTNTAKKNAKTYITKLNNDVQLTDSQKNVLEQYAAEYYTQNTDANGKTNSKEKYLQKKSALTVLKNHLDSILTPGQKNQLKMKTEQRKGN